MQIIKFSCTTAQGKNELVGNKQLCKMLSEITKTEECVTIPDIAFVKATHSLTRYGGLFNEMLVVGKQFSGILLNRSFL